MIGKGLLRGIDHARAMLDQLRIQLEPVYLFVPVYTECTQAGCGYDNTTGAGKDITCPVCGGRGRVVQEEKRGVFQVRVVIPRALAPIYQPLTTLPEGDVWLLAPHYAYDSFRTVQEEEGAYVLVRGRRAHIVHVERATVERITSTIAVGQYVGPEEVE